MSYCVRKSGVVGGAVNNTACAKRGKDELKVLIEHEWKEFDVEFKEAHPDGGVIVESKQLQRSCSRYIHDVVDTIVAVYDEDGAAILCFTEDDEPNINGSFLCQLFTEELHTYRNLEV